MIDCFLLFQEIGEFPRKKQKPVIERLVSRQAPQSESVNPLKHILEFEGKKTPLLGAFLMYQSTL